MRNAVDTTLSGNEQKKERKIHYECLTKLTQKEKNIN